MDTHCVIINGVTRYLPIREVSPSVRVALFDVLGDWEITEAAGQELATKIPSRVEALVMPDGKATALLHVMGRYSGLPTLVARKAKKPYMLEPIVTVSVKSVTTDKIQELSFDEIARQALAGKRVAIVDDVVSSGGTLTAVTKLLEAVKAQHVATLAIFTEGVERNDVISLGHIPLFSKLVESSIPPAAGPRAGRYRLKGPATLSFRGGEQTEYSAGSTVVSNNETVWVKAPGHPYEETTTSPDTILTWIASGTLEEA